MKEERAITPLMKQVLKFLCEHDSYFMLRSYGTQLEKGGKVHRIASGCNLQRGANRPGDKLRRVTYTTFRALLKRGMIRKLERKEYGSTRSWFEGKPGRIIPSYEDRYGITKKGRKAAE